MTQRAAILLCVLLLLGAARTFGQVSPEQITVQGKGNATTRPFSVNGNWHVEVTADAAIEVDAVAANGAKTTLVNFPAATPPPPVYSGSSTPVASGGTYTVSVLSTGAWQVKIVESGFVANLAIGAVPASPSAPTAAATPPSPASAAPMSPATAAPSYTAPALPPPLATFSRKTDPTATGSESTDDFTTTGPWRVAWSTDQGVKITLIRPNGERLVLTSDTSRYRMHVPGQYPGGPQGIYDPQGHILQQDQKPPPGPYKHVRLWGESGQFHFEVEGQGNWTLTIYDAMAYSHYLATLGAPSYESGVPATASAAPAVPTPPQPPADIPKISGDQARAVVLIKGDNAEGTGFMVQTPSGPAVITNIHVIANNPNLKVTTNTGAFVTVLSEKGASDRDLAMLMIQDAGYSYLQMDPDISKDAQPGDDVITPGNSEGGEVMLNTGGKVKGIGPVKIEIDNPIYHGNSGGPVFHPKSGKVLGVVTEAEAVDLTDDLDKSSFASRNSAISGRMRYFGLRIDTVAAWIPIDSHRFAVETAFLDQFHEQSRRLDAYLNRADHSQPGQSSGNSGNEVARIFLNDEKIMKADHEYTERVTSSDTAQKIELLRSLLFELQSIADSNVDQIKDKTNFYSFDQERAQDEYEYRKALQDELNSISNNVDRLGSLPRSND